MLSTLVPFNLFYLPRLYKAVKLTNDPALNQIAFKSKQYILKSPLNREMHEEMCFFDLFVSLPSPNVPMSRFLVPSQCL